MPRLSTSKSQHSSSHTPHAHLPAQSLAKIQSTTLRHYGNDAFTVAKQCFRFSYDFTTYLVALSVIPMVSHSPHNTCASTFMYTAYPMTCKVLLECHSQLSSSINNLLHNTQHLHTQTPYFKIPYGFLPLRLPLFYKKWAVRNTGIWGIPMKVFLV